MIKTIRIGGKECRLRTSAALPREYRNRFNRDIFSDLLTIKAEKTPDDDKFSFTIEDPAIYEDIVYAMHKHGDPNAPDTVEEWLAGIEDPYAIYNTLSDVIDMWTGEQTQTSESKKKAGA